MVFKASGVEVQEMGLNWAGLIPKIDDRVHSLEGKKISKGWGEVGTRQPDLFLPCIGRNELLALGISRKCQALYLTCSEPKRHLLILLHPDRDRGYVEIVLSHILDGKNGCTVK